MMIEVPELNRAFSAHGFLFHNPGAFPPGLHEIAPLALSSVKGRAIRLQILRFARHRLADEIADKPADHNVFA
jgi:hypothetical protein